MKRSRPITEFFSVKKQTKTIIRELSVSDYSKVHASYPSPAQAVQDFVAQERLSHTILPPPELTYSWSHLTPLPTVKVLVIGQDPYHSPGQAHGLAFSVRAGVKIPPSLRNIFKGLTHDYPDFVPPQSGDLTGWAKQGVLLLNTVLTVRAHAANSHAKHGWEEYTSQVVGHVLNRGEGVVVIAWGKPAEKLAKHWEAKDSTGKNCFLYGVHPSPLSAHRGFFTQGHFLAANAFLKEKNRGEIVWSQL